MKAWFGGLGVGTFWLVSRDQGKFSKHVFALRACSQASRLEYHEPFKKNDFFLVIRGPLWTKIWDSPYLKVVRLPWNFTDMVMFSIPFTTKNYQAYQKSCQSFRFSKHPTMQGIIMMMMMLMVIGAVLYDCPDIARELCKELSHAMVRQVSRLPESSTILLWWERILSWPKFNHNITKPQPQL